MKKITSGLSCSQAKSVSPLPLSLQSALTFQIPQTTSRLGTTRLLAGSPLMSPQLCSQAGVQRGRASVLETKRLKRQLIHNRKVKELEAAKDLRRRLTAARKSCFGKEFLGEIQLTLKESEELKRSVFGAVARDPRPSFKVLKRLQTYEEGWDPCKAFFQRNNLA